MATRQPANPVTQTRTLINSLLDRQYVQMVGPVIRAISNGSTSGIIDQRLRELDAEAIRLAAAGQKLIPSNAVVRALMADFENVMRGNAALVNSAAEGVQLSGASIAGQAVRQQALPGMAEALLRGAGVQWNTPDPEAIAQIVNYTGSDAWTRALGQYPDDVLNQIRNAIVRGVVLGQGPVTTANEVRALARGMPTHTANTLLRTLQLTSYRDASVAHRVANADILAYQVRIAALDDRTCMSCVALHGTRLAINERVDDHHAGRCDSISVVVNRPNPVRVTGEQWFAGRSEAQQRAQMGHANYEAWKAGAIGLQDFPKHTTDPVFGSMIHEASLMGILGDAAQQYYKRNQ